MSATQSPSMCWNRQHRGSGSKQKIVHRYHWQAMLHAWSLILNTDRPYLTYRCWWTDDYREGQVGEPHWHVGKPGKNSYGIAATARKIERERVRKQHAATTAQAEADRP